MVYELIGYNTDCMASGDVRYRTYTASPKIADKFEKIPKIQFTDSGHGIVFNSREHTGTRKPNVYTVKKHVDKFMAMSDNEISMYEKIKRLEWTKEYLIQRLEAAGKLLKDANNLIDTVVERERGK